VKTEFLNIIEVNFVLLMGNAVFSINLSLWLIKIRAVNTNAKRT